MRHEPALANSEGRPGGKPMHYWRAMAQEGQSFESLVEKYQSLGLDKRKAVLFAVKFAPEAYKYHCEVRSADRNR